MPVVNFDSLNVNKQFLSNHRAEKLHGKFSGNQILGCFVVVIIYLFESEKKESFYMLLHVSSERGHMVKLVGVLEEISLYHLNR